MNIVSMSCRLVVVVVVVIHLWRTDAWGERDSTAKKEDGWVFPTSKSIKIQYWGLLGMELINDVKLYSLVVFRNAALSS